jgi:hypothetical protein
MRVYIYKYVLLSLLLQLSSERHELGSKHASKKQNEVEE